MVILLWLPGDFEADATGFPGLQGPGAGLRQDGHAGGSGGAHGGRGGRSLHGYYSAEGYDSVYQPSAMGSGGGDGADGRGGRGGGETICHGFHSPSFKIFNWKFSLCNGLLLPYPVGNVHYIMLCITYTAAALA